MIIRRDTNVLYEMSPKGQGQARDLIRWRAKVEPFTNCPVDECAKVAKLLAAAPRMRDALLQIQPFFKEDDGTGVSRVIREALEEAGE